jgi:hypothetical protein
MTISTGTSYLPPLPPVPLPEPPRGLLLLLLLLLGVVDREPSRAFAFSMALLSALLGDFGAEARGLLLPLAMPV